MRIQRKCIVLIAGERNKKIMVGDKPQEAVTENEDPFPSTSILASSVENVVRSLEEIPVAINSEFDEAVQRSHVLDWAEVRAALEAIGTTENIRPIVPPRYEQTVSEFFPINELC
ncbi:hypothetical protein Aduo_008991 [Ancylostoma duodenale]